MQSRTKRDFIISTTFSLLLVLLLTSRNLSRNIANAETIEEKIVACADNLVIGNRRIDINDQVQRYKNKGLDKAATRIKELYEYVSSEAKISLKLFQ